MTQDHNQYDAADYDAKSDPLAGPHAIATWAWRGAHHANLMATGLVAGLILAVLLSAWGPRSLLQEDDHVWFAILICAFALFAAGCLGVGLTGLVNRTTLIVNQDGIHVHRGPMTLVRRRFFAARNLVSLRVESSSYILNKNAVVNGALKASLADSRTITLARHIRGQDAASDVMAAVEQFFPPNFEQPRDLFQSNTDGYRLQRDGSQVSCEQGPVSRRGLGIGVVIGVFFFVPLALVVLGLLFAGDGFSVVYGLVVIGPVAFGVGLLSYWQCSIGVNWHRASTDGHGVTFSQGPLPWGRTRYLAARTISRLEVQEHQSEGAPLIQLQYAAVVRTAGTRILPLVRRLHTPEAAHAVLKEFAVALSVPANKVMDLTVEPPTKG
ncbi:MAG: hypothetical protein K8I27_08775 [Planctomycetes bacterium]|nr:hypothetical protein [Planctomycetota bacterium]